MGKPGIIALPVLLFLGAVTGYLTYTLFTEATPDQGIVESAYWKELPAPSGNQTVGDTASEVDESQFTEVVTINILDGSSLQGNPDYEPDSAETSLDSLVTWVNQDTVPHTATSGTDPADPQSGVLFSSGFLNQGDDYSIPAADIGKGEHAYYCQVHPFMTSTLTIE
jgi:plastocyanin